MRTSLPTEIVDTCDFTPTYLCPDLHFSTHIFIYSRLEPFLVLPLDLHLRLLPISSIFQLNLGTGLRRTCVAKHSRPSRATLITVNDRALLTDDSTHLTLD